MNLFLLLSFDFGIGVRTINFILSSVWQEEFLVEYGPKFDLELEKLLWEFLLRLDRLLPVPNLAQVVAQLMKSKSFPLDKLESN